MYGNPVPLYSAILSICFIASRPPRILCESEFSFSVFCSCSYQNPHDHDRYGWQREEVHRVKCPLWFLKSIEQFVIISHKFLVCLVVSSYEQIEPQTGSDTEKCKNKVDDLDGVLDMGWKARVYGFCEGISGDSQENDDRLRELTLVVAHVLE